MKIIAVPEDAAAMTEVSRVPEAQTFWAESKPSRGEKWHQFVHVPNGCFPEHIPRHLHPKEGKITPCYR
jgi:hypothetical protein